MSSSLLSLRRQSSCWNVPGILPRHGYRRVGGIRAFVLFGVDFRQLGSEEFLGQPAGCWLEVDEHHPVVLEQCDDPKLAVASLDPVSQGVMVPGSRRGTCRFLKGPSHPPSEWDKSE